MQDMEKITGDILRELEELNKLGEDDMVDAEAHTDGGLFGTLCCC